MNLFRYIVITLLTLASVFAGCLNNSNVHGKFGIDTVKSKQYFYISYSANSDTHGDGYIMDDSLPNLDSLRSYASHWASDNGCGAVYSDSDIVIMGIYRFADSLEYANFFTGKIIRRCVRQSIKFNTPEKTEHLQEINITRDNNGEINQRN